MEKNICPCCKKEKDPISFMWDLVIDGKQEMCVLVCEDCNKDLNLKTYQNENKDKQIAELQAKEKIHNALMLEGSKKIDELQETLSDAQKGIVELSDALNKANDKLHRRNMQIAELKKKVGELEIYISNGCKV